MMTHDIDTLAQKIWDYHHLHHKLKKADAIVVLGSWDTRVAEHGAQLFLDGWAPLLVFSGGLGKLTKKIWTTPEADLFADIAIKMGVPEDKIIIENQSTNTGENIQFTQKLFEEKQLHPQTIILVQKPYGERRAYATAKVYWPDKDIIMSSPPISFADYPNEQISKDHVINSMVGTLQRMKEYPKRGFQVAEEIPEDVWDAYEELVRLGYNTHLIDKK